MLQPQLRRLVLMPDFCVVSFWSRFNATLPITHRQLLRRVVDRQPQEGATESPVLGHLDHITSAYVAYHKTLRPHQGLGNVPIPDRGKEPPAMENTELIGKGGCDEWLGGCSNITIDRLHEY